MPLLQTPPYCLVYLENVTNSLPNGFKSIIRYDADCTTIFIENFNELMEDCSIATAVREGWRRQQWARNIKKMAVPVRCFMGDIGEIWGTGDEGRGEFLKIFESLEEWKGATFKALGEACCAALMRGYSSFAQGTQKELEIYQNTFNQGYNVSKVSLMKLAN
jgi:hypothetical protein